MGQNKMKNHRKGTSLDLLPQSNHLLSTGRQWLLCSVVGLLSSMPIPAWNAEIVHGVNPLSSVITSLSSRERITALQQSNKDGWRLSSNESANASGTSRFVSLPLHFEENRGQLNSGVMFAARGRQGVVFLDAHGLTLVMIAGNMRPDNADSAVGIGEKWLGASSRRVVRVEFVGAESSVPISGVDRLPGKANYFLGRDPVRWRMNVPTFSRLRARGVYPGIDVVFYGPDGKLEFDFELSAGANPEMIRLAVKGTNGLSVGHRGDLVASVAGKEVILRRPDVFQEVEGRRREIPAAYEILGENLVGFKIAEYDRQRRIVIDPVLTYSTFLGGTVLDEANDLDVDGAGNVYIVGSTISTDFPTTPGSAQESDGGGTCFLRNCFDVFVAKIDPTGSTLLYSTYLGGDGDDAGSSIAIDSQGSAYIVGTSNATDFPTTTGAFQTSIAGGTDAFVAKLSADGSNLVYSTYLGGLENDTGGSIAINSSGEAHVTGFTPSANFPITFGALQPVYGGGSTDGFMAKFSSDGTSLVYSTFLGGSGTDRIHGLALGSAGHAVVVGLSDSADFPTAAALQPAIAGGIDGFVSKIALDGSSLVYSTYLGGASDDRCLAIALDSSDNVYVTGSTFSSDFPTANAFQEEFQGVLDAFVAKLTANGSALAYSTYLGGAQLEVGEAIAVAEPDRALVTGFTSSTDFPTIEPFRRPQGGNDIFLAQLSPSGASLEFSSHLGGSQNEDARSVELDAAGNIFLTGSTGSADFPMTSAALQPVAEGFAKAFVVQVRPADAPGISLSATGLTFSEQSIGTISMAQTVTLRNVGSAPLSITEFLVSGDFSQTNTCGTLLAEASDCTLSVTFSPAARGPLSGTLTVTSEAADSPHTIDLSGTGIAPVATLSTGSVSFPDTNINTTSAPQNVTLSNTGQDPLTITQISTTGDYAQSDDCADVLPNGSNCTISVTFIPIRSGARNGVLRIANNASGSPHTVNLGGTGVGPNVSLSASTLSFLSQPIGTTSGPENLTLTNDGNAPLSIGAIGTTGDFAQTNNCGSGLNAGESCTLQVAFGPQSEGVTFGAITIPDNAPGNPHIVPLTGNGISGTAPVAYLSSKSLQFNPQPLGTTSPARILNLTNTGNAPLEISAIEPSGDFMQSNDCGASVQAAGECTINVQFTPQAVGTRSGAVTIATNASGSPHTGTLSGVGTDFAITSTQTTATVRGGEEAAYTLNVVPIAGFNLAVSLTCAAVPQATTCALTPASLTLDGNNTATVEVKVQTTALSGGTPGPLETFRFLPPLWETPTGGNRIWVFVVLVLLTMAGALHRAWPARRAWVVAMLAGMALVVASCGVSPDPIRGTPPGSYVLTVTATSTVGSETLTHEINLGLTVNR